MAQLRPGMPVKIILKNYGEDAPRTLIAHVTLISISRQDSGYSENVDYSLSIGFGPSYDNLYGYIYVNGQTVKGTNPRSWGEGVYSKTIDVTVKNQSGIVPIALSIRYESWPYHGSGHGEITYTETFTANVEAQKALLPPVVSPGWFTINRDNSGTGASAITEWVKGFSKASVTFDPSKVTVPLPSTSLTFSVIYNGDVYTATNNVAVTGTITDLRATLSVMVSGNYAGQYVIETQEITLLEYVPPTLTAADVYRSDSSKTAKDDGHYITAKATPGFTSLNGKNRISMTAKYGPLGGEYGSSVTLPSSTPTIINASEISAENSYQVLIEATDLLGKTASYLAKVLSSGATFHLKSGGHGAAFGKVAEKENTLQVAWDLEALEGVIAGAVKLKATRIASDVNNVPSGWTSGVIVILGESPDDRYYLAIRSDGKLYTGYALGSGNTITWTEK